MAVKCLTVSNALKMLVGSTVTVASATCNFGLTENPIVEVLIFDQGENVYVADEIESILKKKIRLTYSHRKMPQFTYKLKTYTIKRIKGVEYSWGSEYYAVLSNGQMFEIIHS